MAIALRTVAPEDALAPVDGDAQRISEAVEALASAFYATPSASTRRRISWRSVVDRTFDLVMSSLLLVVMLPVLAVLVLLVRCTSAGPAVYKQVRVGRHGSLFACYKLRTMVVDADRKLADLLASDPELAREFTTSFKLRHDPRITRVGRFLRRTSLDELPQIINVMRGQMSLVGPRPMVPSEIVRYGDALGGVLAVRPGMTGPWQVSGRSDLPYHERVRLDAEFAAHHSVPSNFKIIAKTGLMMVRPRSNGAC